MATVGLYTLEDLWDKFGDLKMPKVSSLKTLPTLFISAKLLS